MRHRLVIVTCLLVVGAAINVGLAWSLSLCTGFASTQPLERYWLVNKDHHWTVHRWNQAAGTRIISQTWHGFGGGPYPEGDPARLLAAWGHIRAPVPGSLVSRTQLDEAWGFPMRTFSCRFENRVEGNGASTLTRQFILRLGKAPKGTNRPRYLPLKPLWMGFTVNSVVYALVALVLFAVGRDVFRRAVRGRGQTVPADAGGSDRSPYTH